jgi:hypothetical protein
MQQIPTIFVRDAGNRVTAEWTSGCEWVRDGEGLAMHGQVPVASAPRTFGGLREWLRSCKQRSAGLVWHHPDGRMAEIKRSDFGMK